MKWPQQTFIIIHSSPPSPNHLFSQTTNIKHSKAKSHYIVYGNI